MKKGSNNELEIPYAKAHRAIAVGILLIPIILVLMWHLCNHGLPNDDAANYAQTALQIADSFNNGFLVGTASAIHTRGWRPIAFPPLAVPFLLLTGNDIIAAGAATLLVIYAALTFYLYRLAQLYSVNSLVAATASSAVISLPAIAFYSLVFFSELAWLFCSVACVYHLLRSGPFRNVYHALGAGLWGDSWERFGRPNHWSF